MTTREELSNIVTKLPSQHYGLLYTPSIEGLNHIDHFGHNANAPTHWSDLNHQVLLATLQSISDPRLVVEIGVDSPFSGTQLMDMSSTKTILDWKPAKCTYIGIDINDKSYLNDETKNIYTLQNSSVEVNKLYELMERLSLSDIDIMCIDGFHSINEVLWEWSYWSRMRSDGVMIFHDTNSHPGPIVVLDAVDPDIFTVQYHGEGLQDWGIATVHRK